MKTDESGLQSRKVLGNGRLGFFLNEHAAGTTRAANGTTAAGASPKVTGRGLAAALAGEASLDDVAASAGRVDLAAVLAGLELRLLNGRRVLGDHDGGGAEGQEGEDGEELHFGG